MTPGQATPPICIYFYLLKIDKDIKSDMRLTTDAHENQLRITAVYL